MISMNPVSPPIASKVTSLAMIISCDVAFSLLGAEHHDASYVHVLDVVDCDPLPDAELVLASSRDVQHVLLQFVS
jgi:hypothetical protein